MTANEARKLAKLTAAEFFPDVPSRAVCEEFNRKADAALRKRGAVVHSKSWGWGTFSYKGKAQKLAPDVP